MAQITAHDFCSYYYILVFDTKLIARRLRGNYDGLGRMSRTRISLQSCRRLQQHQDRSQQVLG